MIFPIQELSIDKINQIKTMTKLRLLEKATRGWQRPISNYVIREVVFGDSTVTDIYDIEPRTAVSAGIPQWAFDANDLTADDLSSVVKAGEDIDDDAYIGFYGFFDLGLEAGETTGAADTPPSNGAFVSAKFVRGSSDLDFWQLEHLYSYDYVMGITNRPVIYTSDEKIDIKVCCTEATTDKFAGFRAYICEPAGRNISPTLGPELRAIYGVDSLDQLPLEEQKKVAVRAGIDPLTEVTPAMVDDIYNRAVQTLYQMVVDAGLANSVIEAKENYIIREAVGGDKSDATDFVDFDQSATAQTTGQQNWAQDASAITAGDLSSVLASGTKVPDKKFIAVIGFADKTANPSLIGMSLNDGAGMKEFWQTEHCYVANAKGGGLSQRITYFKQNSPFDIKMNFKVARDNFVIPRILICEQYGDVISSA